MCHGYVIYQALLKVIASYTSRTKTEDNFLSLPLMFGSPKHVSDIMKMRRQQYKVCIVRRQYAPTLSISQILYALNHCRNVTCTMVCQPPAVCCGGSNIYIRMYLFIHVSIELRKSLKVVYIVIRTSTMMVAIWIPEVLCNSRTSVAHLSSYVTTKSGIKNHLSKQWWNRIPHLLLLKSN